MFYLLEIVDHSSETQFQVTKKIKFHNVAP